MAQLRRILVSCLFAASLSGCVTAAASLAMTAVSAVSGDNEQPFKNPIDRHTTGREIRDALSRLDDRVDPACQEQLAEYRASEVYQTPMKPAQAAAAEGAEPAAETDTASEPAEAVVQPVSAPAAEVQVGPGQCRHKMVCLPGTPKPTMMLMCPSKAAAGGDQAKAHPVKVHPAEGVDAEAKPAEAADTAEVTDTTAGSTERDEGRSGGIADWNWGQDPAKQL